MINAVGFALYSYVLVRVYPYVMQVLGGLAAEAMAGAQLKPEEREMMERARKLLFEHPSHSFRQLNVCHYNIRTRVLIRVTS